MNRQIAKKLCEQGHSFITSEVTSGGTGGSSQTGNSVLDKPFFSWFWEVVLGNSSEEYRREFYCELHRGHTIGPSPISFGRPDFKSSSLPYTRVIENDLLFRLVFLMIPGTLVWLVRHVISVSLRKTRRPSYYEKERERRIALGITRRSIRMRKTVNREPTVDEIRVAWNGARHSPEGALLLGGMLEDLECYVNNMTIGNEAEGYRGRRGGIKRHLQANAPDLFKHYAALMRYKSIAKKFRQACNIYDPNPTDALLPMSAPPRPQKARTNWSEQIKQCQDRVSASTVKTADKANGEATVTTESKDKRSEKIKRSSSSVGSQGDVTDKVRQNGQETNWSEQIKQSETGCGEGVWQENVVQRGVKVWVLDDFMFAWREDCSIKRESYETAIRVLRACENSVISLEAALALEIDPNFVTDEAVKRYGDQIETTTKRLKVRQDAKQAGQKKCSRATKEPEELKKDRIVQISEETGPNKSSDAVERTTEAGRVLTRVAKWLKRRTCA